VQVRRDVATEVRQAGMDEMAVLSRVEARLMVSRWLAAPNPASRLPSTLMAAQQGGWARSAPWLLGNVLRGGGSDG
jgi:hypothetical protein